MRTDLRPTSKERTIACVRTLLNAPDPNIQTDDITTQHDTTVSHIRIHSSYTVRELHWPPINTWSLVNSWATAARCNEISNSLAHLYSETKHEANHCGENILIHPEHGAVWSIERSLDAFVSVEAMWPWHIQINKNRISTNTEGRNNTINLRTCTGYGIVSVHYSVHIHIYIRLCNVCVEIYNIYCFKYCNVNVYIYMYL